MRNGNYRLYGGCGLLGVALIGISFAINQGPPPNLGLSELIRLVERSRRSVVWGGWLQAVGPVFISMFALGLTRLAEADRTLPGMMTLFGCLVLIIVNLLEVTLYMSALFANPSGMPQIGLEMIYSVQHLYFIVAAPLLFGALGAVLWSGTVLPRAFAYAAFVLGGVFAILGCATLTWPILPASVTALGAVQAVWWLAASVYLMWRRPVSLSSQPHGHTNTG